MKRGLVNNDKNTKFVVDNWRVQVRLLTILPNASSRTRDSIISRLYSETFPSCNSQDNFNQIVDLRLEALCRERRDNTVTPIERRRRDARDGGAPLSRAEMLKRTAAAALDFDGECSRCDESGRPDLMGDVVLLNVTHLNKGKFIFMRVSFAFLADLKRVWKQLRLKSGRLYVSTTKDVDHFGKKISYLCPLISIVAARKYDIPQFNSTLLSARIVNGNPLDLSYSNVYIPAMEQTPMTERMNDQFNKAAKTQGHSDGRLVQPGTKMDAKPKRPKGAGPDDGCAKHGDGSYMHWFMSRWTPATDLSPRLLEKENQIESMTVETSEGEED